MTEEQLDLFQLTTSGPAQLGARSASIMVQCQEYRLPVHIAGAFARSLFHLTVRLSIGRHGSRVGTHSRLKAPPMMSKRRSPISPNSIPGDTEVSKLADRKKAVARIWKAVQPLAGSKAEANTKKAAKGGESARKAKAAKKAAPAKKATRKPKADRSNKKAEVIAMMQRAKGADPRRNHEGYWLAAPHGSGFVSIPGSKGGEKIESSKNAAGERTYKITK